MLQYSVSQTDNNILENILANFLTADHLNYSEGFSDVELNSKQI